MNRLSRTLTRLFGSQLFFYLVLGLLVFQALWFVFSAVYPMAFDEDFHLGIIRIYAEQWSPFLQAPPDGADQFGAVARDPSYFYHYLMSFPYRFVALFTQNEATEVVLLRLINVALFAAGLMLFRKVMLRARASPALTHISLALFVLIPIVPQLAAHINYDNLLVVLLPLMCLAVFALADGFRKQHVNTSALLSFLAVSLFMSIVKYPALPFIVAAMLFLLYLLFRDFRGRWAALWPTLRSGFIAMKLPVKICLVLACVVGSVLFIQRYGVNMVQYKTPVPDCGQVLTVEQCMAYGPWGRDYLFEQARPTSFSANPVIYMEEWFRGMWHRTFFAVNGPASNFTNYLPLPLPAKTAIIIAVLGFAAVIVWARTIFRDNRYLAFFALTIGVYVVILWFDEYGMYRQTGQPVAINGRYLLPILPMLAVLLGRGLHLALAKLKLSQAKAWLAALTILLFLHGGGLLTFILRSDRSWYWQSPTVYKVNETAQNLFSPIIIEGKK